MKLNIYGKMMIGFTIIIVMMVVANAYVLVELNRVTDTTKVTLVSDVRAIDLAKQMQTYLYDEERFGQKYLISHDEAYFTLFTEQGRRLDQFVDSLLATSPSTGEVAVIQRVREGHFWFFGQIQNAKEHANPPAASDSVRSDTVEALHAALDGLIRMNQVSISETIARVGATTVRSSNVAYLLTIGALLAAITVALVIARTITRPIGKLIRGTDHIARGIFEPITISSRDEIGMLANAINEMSDKLKQINDLKTELMHHLSHELRTPLQTMLSADYLLAEQRVGPLNEDQKRLLSSIREGINKLSRFSNQFLDISKIESGRMEYRFEPVNFRDIVRTEVEDAQLIASRKRITVTLTAGDKLPEINADVEKISQVVSNLLSNAIKYTPENGAIAVALESSETKVTLRVTDTGVGIAKEDLPHIFSKFYQAKNVGKASSKGTGVGLALVKALVEGHGGTVDVTSRTGHGSTFTVELPVPARGEQIKDNGKHVQATREEQLP